MKKSDIKNSFLIFGIMFLLFLQSCRTNEGTKENTIVIKGSDTMVNLTQRWVEEYIKIHPEISLQITGGGSGIGITALLNGTADIANMSRDLKSNELKRGEVTHIEPFQYKVALDGIAVIVNPKNKIDSLTIEQIKGIYSDKIKNWKEVGGENLEIVKYGRENSSGTYEYFKERVLGKNEKGKSIDFAVSTQVLQGTAALGEAIANDIKGIGYGGVGYFAQRKDLKIIYLKDNPAHKAVSPVANGEVNYKVIRDGVYPLSRYLYCYTNHQPKNSVKDFINFMLSENGQMIVKEMEYIPLNEKLLIESN